MFGAFSGHTSGVYAYYSHYYSSVANGGRRLPTIFIRYNSTYINHYKNYWLQTNWLILPYLLKTIKWMYKNAIYCTKCCLEVLLKVLVLLIGAYLWIIKSRSIPVL